MQCEPATYDTTPHESTNTYKKTVELNFDLPTEDNSPHDEHSGAGDDSLDPTSKQTYGTHSQILSLSQTVGAHSPPLMELAWGFANLHYIIIIIII